ncbi:MAG: YHS domain-containing (seleno)protein [Xanthobacteraceae bacterium]
MSSQLMSPQRIVRWLVVACALVFTNAAAAAPEIYTGIVRGTAVGGYDPVAYFTQGKPVPGRRDITLVWNNVTWRFANEKNRELFKAKPEAYAPQYGGYCAYAVSQGYTAHGDPRHWSVVGGRLYLNYNASVKRTWDKDQGGYIAKGDKHWPKVLEK